MLFNSFEFLFFFLPITLALFSLCGCYGFRRSAAAILVAASIFFYGWGNPSFIWLILFSIGVNYFLAQALDRGQGPAPLVRKLLLAAGILFDLGLLGYYKYAGFFMENIAAISGTELHLGGIVQPLAISFFTFQQIAFLVDTYRRQAHEKSFSRYLIFVTFFPQLISGPIVRHHETMPQFSSSSFPRISARHVSMGLTLFFIGLFKKVVLADSLAPYVSPIFQAAELGSPLSFFDAWAGGLAYTFQLYFDFSGYSDMALGIARAFGIYLPLNFNSPYKARNLTEFWKRWHMSLSRFFRDYLYIPLGGNRKGTVRQYLNIMLTMLLCGLWHGASWTFVAWGALHGFYLVVNHAWHRALEASGLKAHARWTGVAAQAVTFSAVVAAWVLFRAESFTGALNLFHAMSGMQGFAVHAELTPLDLVRMLAFLAMIVFFLPNAVEFVDRKPYESSFPLPGQPGPLQKLQWQPTVIWMLFVSACALGAIYNLSTVNEFIYSNF